MLRVLSRLQLLLWIAFLPGVAEAQDLVPLALSGDLPALRSAIPEGSDANPEDLVHPLYLASQKGHEEVVNYLLDLGANPNSATSFGTPLGIAARNSHLGIVAALLAAGADPNLPGGEYGMMPLHQAAERGAIESASLLLKGGADVNARTTRWGWPSIYFAGSRGQTEMVAFLREMGAAPEPVDALRPGELEAADLEEGRLVAIECGGCHGMTIGETGSGPHPGPNLVGVVGRSKASLDGFPYSKEMRKQTGHWTPEELNVFLVDPHNVVPGTTMTGGRQPDRPARLSIIAYLTLLKP